MRVILRCDPALYGRLPRPLPAGQGLPQWPKYTEADGYSLIHLDSTITSGPDTLRPRYEFLLQGKPPFRFQ